MKTYKLGILGCGDFLRWQEGAINKSANVEVKSLFDPDTSRAAKFAERIGGIPVDSEDAVFCDPGIDIVCIFVPPWLRKAMMKKAVDNGKHIISTKPLAPSEEDAGEIIGIVGDKVRCGLIYCRTGNASGETAKKIFASGEIGKMALYKQDWLHHYPAWNDWALDPEKNGGPFMDAMIHNLNIARYLADSDVSSATLFSDNLAHGDLRCSDTDFMKVDFTGNATAYLFITWAADLAVYSIEGNDREHIDIMYMISDHGWRITEENRDGKNALVASKDGQEKVFPVESNAAPVYQRFVEAIENEADIPSDMASVQEAAEDIDIISKTSRRPGIKVQL